ncbi:MAG TPA: hypothetical protein VFQ61_03300 [Polyangiaceae bacterium]|nr:hypothetical protein [Polyangiaceae bacterium]
MSERQPSRQMRNRSSRHPRNQRGTTILEYCALIGLVVLAGIVVLRVLADHLRGAAEVEGLTLSAPSGAAPSGCNTPGNCAADVGATQTSLAGPARRNKEEPSLWSKVAGGARSAWDFGWAMGEARIELGRAAAGKVQDFTDWVYGGINKLEDATGGFPPVQQLGGLLKAGIGTAGGIVQVALNPVDAVQGLVKLNNFLNPTNNLSLALWDTLTSDVSYQDALAKRFADNLKLGEQLIEPYKKDWDAGRPIDAVTHFFGDAILSVAGPKGVRVPHVPAGAGGAAARDAGAAAGAASREAGAPGKAIPPGEGKVFREDTRPYDSDGKTPGTRKSYIDEDGNIQPANPDGTTTPTQHVGGSEPSKSSSPYTSFKEEPGKGKAFGDHTTEVDVARLKADIDSGKIKDVEIIDHDALMKLHDERVAAAQQRYDASPTPKNAERLARSQRDRANSARDGEMLIKGTIPSEYVTPAGGKP